MDKIASVDWKLSFDADRGCSFRYLLFAVIVLAAGLVVLGITALTWMGVIAPWSGRLVVESLILSDWTAVPGVYVPF